MEKDRFSIIAESINEAFEIMDTLGQRYNDPNRPNSLKFNKLDTDPNFLNALKMADDGVNAIALSAQTTTFKDKLASLIGLFNDNVRGINVKRSEILAKKDVVGYEYSRHRWNFTIGTIDDYRDAIIEAINYTFSLIRFTIHATDQTTMSPDDLDHMMDVKFNYDLKPFIDKFLGGSKKGKLKEQMIYHLIGGPKAFTINLADDMSISKMMDICNYISSIDKFDLKDAYVASTKDVEAQVKNIIKRFTVLAKSGHSNAVSKKYVKLGINTVLMLVAKFTELDNAMLYTFEVESKEVIAVLQGLLDYQGE